MQAATDCKSHCEIARAAVQRGRVPEGEGCDMTEVLTWLFNDGSSSMLGAEAESMSVASLQVWL